MSHDPIGRRAAVKKILGGLAALPALHHATAASAFARPEPADCLALLSDPHIDRSPGRRSHGTHLSENFRLGVERLLSLDRPDAVLINGDCARNQGLSGAYTQLDRLIRPLRDAGLPVHFTLGNHDHRARFYEQFPDSFDSETMPLRRCAGVTELRHVDLYRLDSLDVTDQTVGALGDEQRRWLADRLDAAPRRPAVVALHHPPFKVVQPLRGNVGLRDHRETMRLLLSRPQVKAVFYGHLHRMRVQRRDGLAFIGLPATAYRFHPNEPAGFLEARIRPDSLALTRRHLSADGWGDGQTQRLTFR